MLIFISMIIHFIDCVFLYYLCFNIIDKKGEKLIKLTLLALLYGIVVGGVAEYLNFYGYAYRIITTFIMMVALRLISKKNICDIIIIYAMIYLCIVVVQITCIAIVRIIGFDRFYSTLIVQILSLIIINFIYLKAPLYRLFNTIQKEILLKLFIFIAIGIFLISFSYFNFQYTEVIEYILYFSIMILLTLIGFYETLKRVSFYTNDMPSQLHDIKNILITLQISAQNCPNKGLMKDLETAVEILGLEANVEDMEVSGYYDSILALIDKKQKKNEGTSLILPDIKYLEPNSKLGFLAIGYMLGVLLDNAIETNTEKPILVKININEECLIVSVANEYERQGTDDFHKMFRKGYSTKNKDGRGHGLTNLSKFVNKYDGELILEYEYNRKQASNYLIVTVDIGNWKIYNARWIEEILSL